MIKIQHRCVMAADVARAFKLGYEYMLILGIGERSENARRIKNGTGWV